MRHRRPLAQRPVRVPIGEASLASLLPNGVGSKVLRTLSLVEVAAEELARAGNPDAFMLVIPPAGMEGYAPEVYRSHARELLERVAVGAKGKALSLATMAEILIRCSEVTLKAPPGKEVRLLMDRCFLHVFGRRIDGHVEHEDWPKQLDELLAQCRKSYAVEGRGK